MNHLARFAQSRFHNKLAGADYSHTCHASTGHAFPNTHINTNGIPVHHNEMFSIQFGLKWITAYGETSSKRFCRVATPNCAMNRIPTPPPRWPMPSKRAKPV